MAGGHYFRLYGFYTDDDSDLLTGAVGALVQAAAEAFAPSAESDEPLTLYCFRYRAFLRWVELISDRTAGGITAMHAAVSRARRRQPTLELDIADAALVLAQQPQRCAQCVAVTGRPHGCEARRVSLQAVGFVADTLSLQNCPSAQRLANAVRRLLCERPGALPLALAWRCFEDYDSYAAWLTRPQPGLLGHSPLQACFTADGRQRLREMLLPEYQVG